MEWTRTVSRLHARALDSIHILTQYTAYIRLMTAWMARRRKFFGVASSPNSSALCSFVSYLLLNLRCLLLSLQQHCTGWDIWNIRNASVLSGMGRQVVDTYAGRLLQSIICDDSPFANTCTVVGEFLWFSASPLYRLLKHFVDGAGA